MALDAELIKVVIADGIIDPEEVEKIKAAVGEDGIVDRDEAIALFEINNKTTGNNNCQEWYDYFTEAITSHVLDDEESPGKLDIDETNFLIEQIGADGVCDKLELSTCINIIKTATETTDEFIDYVLEKLKASVLEDGIIDIDEVEMIKAVIYGEGGSSGAKIDQKEAEYLYELNDATSGNSNCPEWKDLFVEALSKYYLDDDTSPGEIDADEAEHIKKYMNSDGGLDANEIALLGKIKIEASVIHESLDFMIDMVSND